MRAQPWTIILTVAALLLAGCSDDDSNPIDLGGALDGSVADAGRDTRPKDAKAGGKDAKTGGKDAKAGGKDASGPLAGFGKITGACGVLDATEWKSSKPFLFRNAINFGTAAFDSKKLSAGGQTIWKDGNLGGSSIHSEIFAFEVLYRCELAKLLKTEGKITYKSSSGKKSDLLLNIDTRKVGVSVTRAFQYPAGSKYTEAAAKKLLDKKLADLPKSKANAAAADAWTRSILHVIAYDKQHADMVQAAWSKQVTAATKQDAILMVTVTDGKDDYIY